MQEQDFDSFDALMQGMAENYGQNLTAQGIALRFQMLAGYGLGDVQRAAMAIITSRKYTTMPTVADFMEHMGGGRVEDRAEVQAGKVLDAIGRVGGYASVVFDDPVTQAVIQNAYGGWLKLCEAVGVEESEQWFRKNFAKAYAAYRRQGVQLGGYLAGRSEIGNGSKGLPHLERIAMIGDKAKVQAVLEAKKGVEALAPGRKDAGEGAKELVSGLVRQQEAQWGQQ